MMIENTTDRDPLLHLMGAMDAGTTGYIEGMEAAGQQQLVASTLLPASGPWPELEALGFVRGEPVPGDDLFVHAELPTGWSKAATDHDMWSKIVDDRGIERVSVFYKAAYYDRRADFHLVRPGVSLARTAVWSDGPAGLPACWELMTAAEKQDYAKALEAELANNLETQQYSTGEGLKRSHARADRTRALLALIPAFVRDYTQETT